MRILSPKLCPLIRLDIVCDASGNRGGSEKEGNIKLVDYNWHTLCCVRCAGASYGADCGMVFIRLEFLCLKKVF